MEIIAKSIHSQGRAKDFFRFHLLKRSTSKYLYFIMAIITLTIGVVLIILENHYNALFFLFLSVLILVVRIVTVNITLSKILKNNRFQSINYILKFNEDCVIYQIDTQKKKYKWEEILNVFETNNYLFFYITKSSALILAKYILSKEERESLSKIIKDSQVKYRKVKFK